MNQNSKKQNKTRIILTIVLCIIGITFLNVLNQESAQWDMNANHSHLIRGLAFSALVVIGIWFIKKYYPKSDPEIGLGNSKTALKTFGFGVGLILVPLIITVVLTAVFGWASISINTSGSFLYTFLIGFIATMLTDGLPEELLFRGMLYSNLNVRYSKLKSGAIAVLLFAVFPFLIVAIQKLMGFAVYIGATDRITPSFVITMLFFGSFMQYLRILTNSVWTSIGFHTLFVFMNLLIGTEPHNLIQFSNMNNETPMQVILITLVVLIFIGLLVYPRYTKKPIAWKAKVNAI